MSTKTGQTQYLAAWRQDEPAQAPDDTQFWRALDSGAWVSFDASSLGSVVFQADDPLDRYLSPENPFDLAYVSKLSEIRAHLRSLRALWFRNAIVPLVEALASGAVGCAGMSKLHGDREWLARPIPNWVYRDRRWALSRINNRVVALGNSGETSAAFRDARLTFCAAIEVQTGINGEEKLMPIPKATLERWFLARLSTWPKDRNYPKEEQDFLDAQAAFLDHDIKRENFRAIRKLHVPEGWRKVGRPRRVGRAT